MNFKDVIGTVRTRYLTLRSSMVFMNIFYFSGCSKCYDKETVNTVNGKSMEQLYEDTLEKVCYLKDQGYRVVEMWECDLYEEMEQNEEMKRYFEEYEIVDPLQPRDAFYGGRTNAAKLFHECQNDEEIR